MKALSLGSAGLRIRLALSRFGWTNLIACLLCLTGLVGSLWLQPRLNAQFIAAQRAVKQARHALQSAPQPAVTTTRPVAEERLENFYGTLGDKRYTEQQIKTLFGIAMKNGLVLQQAEYKLATDKSGRFHTYQIVLPVKGTYAAIRQFCEQTLLAIPFASLNEMNFKRDAIGNRTLEAQLRFTLYLSDASMPITEDKP